MSARAGCLLALLLAGTAAGGQTVTVSASIGLPAYQAHLAALQAVVSGCRAQPGPEICSAARVGQDDLVSAGGQTRRVSYDWLRQALTLAAKKDKSGPATMEAAAERLQQEVAGAKVPAATASPATTVRPKLDRILASSEFVHVHQPSLLAMAWDHLLRWLSRHLGAVAASTTGQWLGRMFWLGLLTLGIGALLWWLRREIRRQELAPRPPAPVKAAQNAPQEWQALLAEAERCASHGAWREAVHALYRAAAARVSHEQRWPRDSTRTPREAVELLAPATGLRTDFTALTRTFEQTWYGRRAAGAADFARARTLFERLGSRA